ncbi:MAG: ABC transporter permease [Bacteroidota bacterium]|nr:ABC transporter permease [Bacteroidota bacterium]
MKRFWGFVIKEFYHIFRDKRTMLILFGMPVVQMLLFGFVVTNEIKDIKIAILDYSKDNVTRELSHKILSSGYFVLDQYLDNSGQIEAAFRKGNVKEVVVFEPGFAEKVHKLGKANVQILADASDANTANLISNYTSAIVMDYVRKLNVNVITPMQIIPEVRMMYNEQLKGVYMFVPGIMAMILLLISALLTSISIVREKELGTMEILLVSPLKPIQIIIGKVTPYVLLSFINAGVIILLGNLVFGMPVQGSTILLLAECILFIILALSLGIFISTSTNSQQTAMFMSMFALMLPTILLSGFIFPIANMPLILQALCQLMPPRWFIVIVKNIMLKGTGFYYIWFETLILVLMTCFFIFLSYKKFKIRLE